MFRDRGRHFGLAGVALGYVMAQPRAFSGFKEPEQLIPNSLTAVIAIHESHFSRRTWRSLAAAARICVFTVPTGLLRSLAISS